MILSPTNREESRVDAPAPKADSTQSERSVVRDWMPFAILLVAAFFRFAWLDLKPPHHDEGVVAFMAEGITEKGYFEYDPTNFHGPLPFYLSWVSQRLFGRTIFAMRLPVVMMSILAVGLLLAYREYFKERAIRWAALALAVSPTMVYYGRQCAHEMGAMFFNVLLIWGAVGLRRGGTTRELWATGLGLAGMILCKETYAIHLFAILLAFPALWLLEKISPSAPEVRTCRTWTSGDAYRVACGSLAVVLFFYSGTLMDWSKVEGLWTTWSAWVGRGVSEGTQDQESLYYGKLMLQYEWTSLLGIAAALAALMPGTQRDTRLVALIALAGACGYNLVKYKTPWLVMSWAWPFYLLFGAGVVALEKYIGRRVCTAAAGFIVFLMAAKCWHLNFHNYAPRGDTAPYPEPYAYVQALDDLNKITGPLNALTAMDPANKHIPGAMIGGEQFPLPWLLGEFGRFGWYGKNEEGKMSMPDKWNLDFIQAHVDVAADVEKNLSEAYFRDDFQIRNMGGDRSILYFRAAVFAPVFPGRMPEFIPTSESQPAK
jgi:uncharacterized protein (TIGR03663 family)